MSGPRAIVVRAAGTNCDRETAHALELAGARVETVHVGRLAERPRSLEEYGILVLPGGFSYGDDVASGRILALELERRLGDALLRFVDDGRIVLGICNGFQVLVRMGLLPGKAGRATLTDNDSGRFECRWVTLRAGPGASIFCPPGTLLEMPVAHGEGKFLVESPGVLAKMEAGSQVAFVYEGDGYPANPNGSVAGIAGVADPTGRVLGLMPHPERFVHPWQHPTWTRHRGDSKDRADGRVVFEGAVHFAREVSV